MKGSRSPRLEVMSYLRAARSIASTALTSAPVIAKGALGTLSRGDADRYIRDWAEKNAEISQMDLFVEGREHIEEGQAYVLMSNHQSNWDIIALFCAFPATLRMVAKQEIRGVPLLGQAMESAEFIFVDRQRAARARRAIDLAKERVRSGVSVWIAPEGTRSKDGQVGPFKKGGFALALDTGAKILPVAIEGTRHVVQVGQLRIHRSQRVDLRFFAPIDVQAYGQERRDELIRDVRAIIAEGVRALQGGAP